MRIGFVAPGDLAERTGGNLYDRQLIAHLRLAGDEVVVLNSPPRIAEADFDLLVEDALYRPSYILLNQRLKLGRRLPIIGLVHYLRSCDRRNLFWKIADSAYLASLAGFIFNSAATAGDVAALLDRRKPSVIAWPGADRLPGVPTAEQVAARARAAGPLKILFAGQNIPRKGLQLLTTALSGIPHEKWRLNVANALDDEKLAAAYLESQVLAVPSYYEPAGMAYLEALRFGLPVIATTRGGIGELVAHGREGFLVRPGDVHALRQHLEVMINNRNFLAAMSLRALARRAALPTWEANGKLVRNFLAGL